MTTQTRPRPSKEEAAAKKKGKKHFLRLMASGPGSQTTTLSISTVTPTFIIGGYNTLSGNSPNTYGNTIFLWQNNNSIPYNLPPLLAQAVTGNSQSGSYTLKAQLQNYAYILGYAVGPDPAQICATAFIPATGTQYLYFQTTLDVTPMPDGILVSYNTPTGNQPQTNLNWIGVWEGGAASYTVAPPTFVPVGSNNAVDQIPVPVTLLRGRTYTVAYFMGGYATPTPTLTAMAATLTFST